MRNVIVQFRQSPEMWLVMKTRHTMLLVKIEKKNGSMLLWTWKSFVQKLCEICLKCMYVCFAFSFSHLKYSTLLLKVKQKKNMLCSRWIVISSSAMLHLNSKQQCEMNRLKRTWTYFFFTRFVFSFDLKFYTTLLPHVI